MIISVITDHLSIEIIDLYQLIVNRDHEYKKNTKHF